MFQSAENRVSQSSHLMDDQPWSTPLKPRNSNLPDMDARRSCSSPPGYKLDKEANKDVGPTKMLARRVKNMSENSEATTLKGDDTTVAATGTVPKIPHPARTVASSASMRSATPVDRALVPLKRPEIQLHVTGTQGGQDLSVKPGNVSLEDRECEWPLYRSYHVINKDDETTWPPKNVLLQDWHILVIMRVCLSALRYCRLMLNSHRLASQAPSVWATGSLTSTMKGFPAPNASLVAVLARSESDLDHSTQSSVRTLASLVGATVRSKQINISQVDTISSKAMRAMTCLIPSLSVMTKTARRTSQRDPCAGSRRILYRTR